MTEAEGKVESSASENPVMAHCGGLYNNETISAWTHDAAGEANEKEHVQLKLNIPHIIVTVEHDGEIVSTKSI